MKIFDTKDEEPHIRKGLNKVNFLFLKGEYLVLKVSKKKRCI